MSKIFVPSTGPENWKTFLAKPELHWKKGRSARAVAHAWEAALGLPDEIIGVLRSHPDFSHCTPELLAAFPEWKVPLPGGTRDSQSDVFALIRCGRYTLSTAIEGKVSETFGPTVGEWFSAPSVGKKKRLGFLCQVLGLNPDRITELRYQLLHRAVSAVIERDRFSMDRAAMIVHSFSQSHEWFDDYAAFVDSIGARANLGIMDRVALPDGSPLYCGWATGDAQFLEA